MFFESVRYAAKGSVAKANGWASVGGALLLWGGLYLLGYNIALPETFLQAIFTFLACLGAAWVLIFGAKIIYWPYRELTRMRAERRRNASGLELFYDPKVHAECEQFEYMNAPPEQLLKYSIEVRNVSEARTIEDVVIKWSKNDLTYFVDREIGRGESLGCFDYIHAGESKTIPLFGVFTGQAKGGPAEEKTTIEIEAIGRHNPRVKLTLEYDPEKSPRLNLV